MTICWPPDEQTQTGITVEYDPANLAAALTVAAAVPGATLVPTDGLGSQVRLLLGESYDGTVQAVVRGCRRHRDARRSGRPGPSTPESTVGHAVRRRHPGDQRRRATLRLTPSCGTRRSPAPTASKVCHDVHPAFTGVRRSGSAAKSYC